MIGSVPGAPDPCETVKADTHESYVDLHAIYPNVPPGTYTLRVILAPRATSTNAEFPPLAVIFP
jgi:hypothetical protein